MCKIMQKLQAEGHTVSFVEGKQKGILERCLEERISLALDMLCEKTMDEIIKYSRLTPEHI